MDSTREKSILIQNVRQRRDNLYFSLSRAGADHSERPDLGEATGVKWPCYDVKGCIHWRKGKVRLESVKRLLHVK